MRCSHCGYHSFDHLSHCKKCGASFALPPLPAIWSDPAIEAVTALAPLPPESLPSTEVEPWPVVGDLLVPQPEPAVAEARATFASLPFTPRQPPVDPPTATPQPQPPVVAAEQPPAVPVRPEKRRAAESSLSDSSLLWRALEQPLLPEAPDEGLSLLERLALALRRLLAALIDGLLQVLLWLAACWLALTLGAGPVPLSLWQPLALLAGLILLVYAPLFHYAYGQTPGQQLLQLRLCGQDAAPVRLGQALLRRLAALLMLVPLGLPYAALLWRTDGQGWHDRVAGTRLIDDGALAQENLESPESLAEAGPPELFF
ncbi:RDD family protein [Desulfuromonas thiophila]|uniref:RDD family protein n=1 Tax=Desulfuromonas thiophila TaxID=57664 RepID=UPI0029F4D8A3|nr:RDD family protein [Desulfuromonas thiophila]